jgi:hypothetical protein
VFWVNDSSRTSRSIIARRRLAIPCGKNSASSRTTQTTEATSAIQSASRHNRRTGNAIHTLQVCVKLTNAVRKLNLIKVLAGDLWEGKCQHLKFKLNGLSTEEKILEERNLLVTWRNLQCSFWVMAWSFLWMRLADPTRLQMLFISASNPLRFFFELSSIFPWFRFDNPLISSTIPPHRAT